MKKLLLAAACVAALAAPTYARGPLTGKEWVNDCSNKKSVDSCLRYARGIADGLKVWESISEETADICIPQEVDSKQLALVGHKFITKRPKDANEAAGWLLATAFLEAWPCKKEKGQDV